MSAQPLPFPRTLPGGAWTLLPAKRNTFSLVEEIGSIGPFKILRGVGGMSFHLSTDIPHPDDATKRAEFKLDAAPTLEELAALLVPFLPMTKDRWLERCADRFQKQAAVSAEAAANVAVSCWNNTVADVGSDQAALDVPPEDAADIELSYWRAES